jgi:hypothetical protein
MNRFFLLFCLILILLLSITHSLAASIPSTPTQTEENNSFIVHMVADTDMNFYHHMSQTDIVLGENGPIHISFRGPNRDLQYANKNLCDGEDAWLTESVEHQSVGVARENGIALLSGHPVISFSQSDGSNEDLYLAEMQMDNTWVATPIDARNPFSIGLENDIAVDSMDNIHVSHWNWNNRDLFYTHKGVNGWETEIIDSGNVDWGLIRIAIDSQDTVHIVYAKQDDITNVYEIWHAYGVSRSWVTEKIMPGYHPSLAIDDKDNLHVSFDHNQDFYYATNASDTSEDWVYGIIASGVNIDDINSDRAHDIAVDQNGIPHVSFFDATSESLMYTSLEQNGWSNPVVVDSIPKAGYSNAIAVDQFGTVHISYRYEDQSHAELRYATNMNCFVIDVRPGQFPNKIYLHHNKTTKVAILSSPVFDAPSEIDWNSLTFGHTGVEDSLHRRGPAQVPSCHARDENNDGYDDLTCHFDTLQTGLIPGDPKGILMGMKLNGTSFSASDSVIVKPGNR